MISPGSEGIDMLCRLVLTALALVSAPALAEADELAPIPAQVLIGRSYAGDFAASQIRFINVRSRPVTITWIAFNGTEQPYAVVQPGDEIVQPTFVGHRWLAQDQWDGTPLHGFISTRSAARDNGAAQIAIIR